MPSRLGQKIFLGTALVVVAILGAALLVTKRQADTAADAASARAVRATQSAIGDALAGRALEGQTTEGIWIEPGPAGDELYQAVGVPVADPGSARPFGMVVAALRIDSTFARQLQRHTNSEI